jgi:hypothetical protein
VRPLGSYPGLLITRRIRIGRTLRTKRREIRYGSNTDVYRFRYPLNRTIGGKKNIILDRESSIV